MTAYVYVVHFVCTRFGVREPGTIPITSPQVIPSLAVARDSDLPALVTRLLAGQGHQVADLDITDIKLG